MIGHCKTRAVATNSWSAGSRWKGWGSWVDSTTIRGWRCRSDTPGSARAFSIQSPTGRSIFSLPYSTSFATSQQEMMLMPKTRSGPSSRSTRCLGCSRSGLETHRPKCGCPAQSQEGVPVLAGNRLQGITELEDRISKACRPRSLILRLSRPPTLQLDDLARMEGPSKRVRRAPRLWYLSSVPARPQYRGSGHEMCCERVGRAATG
jgi:hypothetical protein